MQESIHNKVGLGIQAISLLLSMSFVCSVLYNYSYFYALGLPSHFLPLTLLDYSETTLLWSMPMGAVLAGILFVELVLKRLEGGLTEEELIQSTSNPERTRKLRESPYKFIKLIVIIFAPIPVLKYLLFGLVTHPIVYYVPILFVSWIMISNWLFGHYRIRQRTTIFFRLFVFAAPLVAMFMFRQGYNTALHDLTNPTMQYIIFTKDTQNNGNQVNVLRTFNQGVLVSSHKELVFYNWSDIKEIVAQRKKIKSHYFKGIICDWFHYHCSRRELKE